MRTRLHLVGAGNLGGALLQAWLSSDIARRLELTVSDPRPSAMVQTLCRDRGVPLNGPPHRYDVCVLAVKPQSFSDVLSTLDRSNTESSTLVSIAAGVSIDAIRNIAPQGAEIVRAMPNLPAAIGQGATLLYCDRSNVSETAIPLITQLFDAVGNTVWTKSEDQLDQLMGISGCGPAYVFLLAEVLESVASSYGATPEDARTLAKATIVGAANHLEKSCQSPAELRQAVTSPGGTTAEALRVLEGDPSLRSLMKAAVDAAYVRAHALSLL